MMIEVAKKRHIPTKPKPNTWSSPHWLVGFVPSLVVTPNGSGFLVASVGWIAVLLRLRLPRWVHYDTRLMIRYSPRLHLPMQSHRTAKNHHENHSEKSFQDERTIPKSTAAAGSKIMTMPTEDDDDDNNSDGDRMMVEQDLEEKEDEEETAPAFLDPNDQAIEVPVDDYEPLAEEEEEDEDQDNNADAPEREQQLPEQDEMSTRQIQFHSGPIYAVEFFVEKKIGAERRMIVTGGGDDQAALHDIDGASSLSRSLHQAKDSVVAIAVCANFIAIGSYDGRIIVLSSSSDDEATSTRFELDGPTDVEWLNFHPTGSVLLAGSTDGTVWMYSVSKTGAQCMQVFVGHEAAVTAGSFLLKVAATCAADGTVRIWAPKTGLAKHVFRCSEMGLTCLAVGGGVDGKLVLAGGEDGMAYCCHIGSQKIIHRFEHTARTAVAPMAVQRGDDDEEEHEEEMETPPISVEAVGFAPVADSNNPTSTQQQQQWCATAGVDGVLKIWDVTSGQCRHVCRVGVVGGDSDTGGITRLQWIAQHYVVTCGTTGIVRIWDARSGTLRHTLTARGRSVMNDLAVSVDDDITHTITIVAGSDDGIARVFTVSKDVLQLTPAAAASPAL
jgi:angio-associated migratory cell protein